MEENEHKSLRTHSLLSVMIDIWIPDKPRAEKTELMNYLIISMNQWLDWKYHRPPEPEYVPINPPERPAFLYGSQLDTRIWSAMRDWPFESFAAMAAASDKELLRMPNFGRKSLKRLRELAQQQELEKEKCLALPAKVEGSDDGCTLADEATD